MSNPRGTGRGSRTAAVVMLAVFLQVLVVAVLGLGAITRDRQEARRKAEQEAQEDAERALQAILDRAAAEVRHALQDVREYPDFAGFEVLRSMRGHGRHADLIGSVYQVDRRTGVIYWMDGELRLYVPPAERARLIEESGSSEREAAAEDLYRQYKDGSQGVSFRIRKGLDYCREFPYRFGRYDYAEALVCARNLVELARDEALMPQVEQDPDRAYDDLEKVLLRATEVAALNADRAADLDVGDRAKLEELPDEVEAAMAAALPPEREGIRRHVEAVRDARRLLAGDPPEVRSIRALLEVALGKMGVTDDVTLVGDHLLGLIPQGGGTTRDMIALLSLPAMRHLVESMADANQLARLGHDLHVVPASELEEETVAVSRDLRQVEGLRIPYRAELRLTRATPLPAEGPGELFYWSIIGLSAAGLGMGGWVLMRLYTREVRLARLKADFVSNLSHELKTPLTSIAMFTEMLQDGQLSSEEDRKEGVAILAQEAERLQGIVHRMLDTARREARGVEYELALGDLNGVVGKAAERFRRIVTEPGLDLTVALSAEPLPVRMDGAAIDDVVSNLVSNAWKYKHGSEARVEVRTVRRGRWAEIVVADDGLGIPRGERRKVFEMFYRADAYLTRAAGTGLGLSLVRTIVKAHRGTVRIESGLDGRGSLFRIRLPLTKAKVAVSEPADSMTPNPEAEVTS